MLPDSEPDLVADVEVPVCLYRVGMLVLVRHCLNERRVLLPVLQRSLPVHVALENTQHLHEVGM
jgi:hypothetical protein